VAKRFDVIDGMEGDITVAKGQLEYDGLLVARNSRLARVLRLLVG
jgi:hypothetical protein